MCVYSCVNAIYIYIYIYIYVYNIKYVLSRDSRGSVHRLRDHVGCQSYDVIGYPVSFQAINSLARKPHMSTTGSGGSSGGSSGGCGGGSSGGSGSARSHRLTV